MGFYNDAKVLAFKTGVYICHECGKRMEWEDANEDILVCPACSHSVDLDNYGFEGDENYENLYPKEDEV